MEELLSLKWNNHRSTFLHILGVLRDKQAYTDVTLACDGKFYSVHKLVLSTCSDYFSAMFDKTTCKNPIIVLKDIKCEDLEALLDYMYLGEVNVRQCDLASLIKAAECLRVKGLAVPDDEPAKKPASVPLGTSRLEHKRESYSSPPAKRKRRDEAEDGRDDVRPVVTTPSRLNTPPPPPPAPIRPKSPPVQARHSPSPHRTPRESASTSENRVNRPFSSPVDTSQQQPTTPSNDQSRPEDSQTFVKVEMEDDGTRDMPSDSYDLSADGYKEEEGDSSELNNDLPEFLQQAASGALGGSFSHHFAGPSGYQHGELGGWQGEGSSLGFPSHLNYSTSDSSQQNAPGEFGVTTDESCGKGGLLTCPLCGKTAQGRNRRQNMDNHILTHTGERPYQCTLCSYRASQQGNLKRHLRSVHHQGSGADEICALTSLPFELSQQCQARSPPLIQGQYNPARSPCNQRSQNSMFNATMPKFSHDAQAPTLGSLSMKNLVASRAKNPPCLSIVGSCSSDDVSATYKDDTRDQVLVKNVSDTDKLFHINK